MAIALILLGVVAVVKAMSTSLAADNSIDGQVIALKLAQEEIETVKSSAYANISSVVSGYTSGYVALAAPFADYSMQVVEQNPVSSALTQITVNVKWNYRSNTMMVSLVTLIANTSNPVAS